MTFAAVVGAFAGATFARVRRGDEREIHRTIERWTYYSVGFALSIYALAVLVPIIGLGDV